MAGELILIIEDNEKNRKLARDVLQHRGYATIEAETAEEGIQLARERLPALILMDIQLPGMDGITALGHLRADPATRAIAVIAGEILERGDPARQGGRGKAKLVRRRLGRAEADDAH